MPPSVYGGGSVEYSGAGGVEYMCCTAATVAAFSIHAGMCNHVQAYVHKYAHRYTETTATTCLYQCSFSVVSVWQ